jgi:hypothetical protein
MTTTVKFTNMSDLMRASPFDPDYDLDQSLTTEIFFREFHVAREQLIAGLDELIESRLEPNRVIFLRGYAGNGKTTFIHTFILHRTNDRPIYLDFTTVRHHLSAESVMRKALRGMTDIGNSLRYIGENRRPLRDFLSAPLFEHLGKLPHTGTPEEWLDETFDLFDLRDTFAVLFIHLFHSFTDAQKTIIYFDNLDTARMEDLANNFLLYFQDALSAAIYISRLPLFAGKEIDFRSHFRFVFALRESNEAILNAHLSDRSGFVRAPFELSFDAALYKDVAHRRIAFAAEHFPTEDVLPYGDGRLSHLLNAILEDMYFQQVFLPLYNNDYREVAGLIVGLIREERLNESHATVDFELRGRLMFGVVRNLLTEDFLNDYLRIPANPSGYCYIDRVMLTVLINCSYYRRYPQQQSGDPYSLLYLVRDLLPLYTMHTILNSIARCFMSQQLNRVHLITILDRKVATVDDFVDAYTPMLDVALNDATPQTLKLKNELSAVKVRVNPAGFTYVRYVLPHFEFYSNLVRNKSSLFTFPLELVTNADGKTLYAFEAKIDRVLKQVRDHAKSMKKLFDSRYQAIGVTSENFSTSNYCFRHLGRVELPRQAGGLSHTIRIITTHVNYIDELRRRILADKTLDNAEVTRINEAIVLRIRRYVQLLQHAVDPELADVFAQKFESHTKVIERNLLDRETAIDKK